MPTTAENFVAATRHDYELFAKLALRIIDKAGNSVPFIFNRMQRYLWECLKEDLEAGIPIRWTVYKMRQGGSSHFFQGMNYWLTVFNANRTALITSHDKPTSQNMLKLAQFFHKSSPPWARFRRKTSNRNEMFFANRDETTGDLGIESRILVQTADNKNLGASYTVQFGIFSEVARYQGLGIDVKTMMTAFNNAVPFIPGTVVVWETTPQGMEYFYERWNDPNHQHRRIFIPWVVSEDYRIELDPRDYFLLSDNPESHFGDELEEQLYIRDAIEKWYPEWKDDPERVSQEVWARLAWRRWAINNKCEGSKDAFRQEYPITAERGFLASGMSYFDNFVLSAVRKNLREGSTDLVKFNSMRFNKAAYDPDKKNWHESAFEFSPFGELRVFAAREKGLGYLISVDPTQGESDHADEAAIQVISLPFLVQAAVYCKIVTPDFLADVAAALGYIYNTGYIVVEANGPGHEVIRRLRYVHHYPHLYRRETFNSITRKKEKVYGWNMGAGSHHGPSKEFAMAALDRATRLGELTINDYMTIDEMMRYMKNADGSFGNPRRKDNRVTSLAIGTFIAQNQPAAIIPKVAPRDERYTLAWFEKMLENAQKAPATRKSADFS